MWPIGLLLSIRFNEKKIRFTLRPLRLRIMKFTIFRLLSLQKQYTKSEDYIGTVAFKMKLFLNDE